MKPRLIIDVRTPAEFATGHLEGAVNIPYEQIAAGVSAIAGLEKSSDILLYCRSGARSGIACSVLAQLGFSRAVNGGSLSTLAMNFKLASSDVIS